MSKKYLIEKQLTTHHSKCWGVEQTIIGNIKYHRTILGPFLKDGGYKIAQQILDLLNNGIEHLDFHI